LQKIISQAFVAGMSQSFYMSTNWTLYLQIPEKRSRQDMNTKFRPRRHWSLFSLHQCSYWF
jgi:hypothetical protein